MTRVLPWLWAALVVVPAAAARSAPASPQLSQTPSPGPELFAAGTVSTDAPEFATTFTPDGVAVYFTRASADRTRLTIMTSVREGSGAWSAPVAAPFSGTFRDVDPFVTPDGRRLFFSSDRPRPSAPGGLFATWYVERTHAHAGWGPPIDPGAPLNSEAGDVFVSAARDGTVVFTSSRLGTPRVFMSRESDGRWQPPVPVAFDGRPDGGNPALAPSGRFMVVTRVPAGGSPDLFVSCRTGGAWSTPRALERVNSSFADFAAYVDAREEYLYFTSERPGVAAARSADERPPGDIYRMALADAGVHCP